MTNVICDITNVICDITNVICGGGRAGGAAGWRANDVSGRFADGGE